MGKQVRCAQLDGVCVHRHVQWIETYRPVPKAKGEKLEREAVGSSDTIYFEVTVGPATPMLTGDIHLR